MQDCTIKVLLPVSATNSNLWGGVPTLTSTVEKMSLFFNGEQVLAVALHARTEVAIKASSMSTLTKETAQLAVAVRQENMF